MYVGVMQSAEQHTGSTLVAHPDQVTADWLGGVLGTRVEGFVIDTVGTGQVSDCYRITLRYGPGASGPASVIMKVPAADANSRQTGSGLGLYEAEFRFYRDMSPHLHDAPLALCHSAEMDTGTGDFHLLMADAAPAVPGNELDGATPEQARAAVAGLGRLHTLLAQNPDLVRGQWLDRMSNVLSPELVAQLYAMFLDRFGARLTADQRRVCDGLVDGFAHYMQLAAAQPQGLIHGDFRLDNLLFGDGRSAPALSIVDWQGAMRGAALNDLAYFLGCALTEQVRADHFDELLEVYLAARTDAGAPGADDVRESVRLLSFAGVTMAIAASVLVEQTDRGDEMFMLMLSRQCAFVIESDALALLTASPDARLRPAPTDERPHPATAEPWWGESWYADFVDEKAGIGGWFRLGVMPNENTTWVHGFLCGPDMPTVAVNQTLPAPLPDPWQITTPTIEFGHEIDVPLHRNRWTLRGTAQAYATPSDALHGTRGRAVPIDVDLVWRTSGRPYRYSIVPRYEIPCTASGTVRIGDTTHTIADVPAQRDHSWAPRDWWSMDWTWSALHLDDGTHVHAVQVRIPGFEAPPMGYVQSSGVPIAEVTAVVPTETFAGDGEITETRVAVEPGGLTLTLATAGHAPIALVDGAGRTTHFLRTWGPITTNDGRHGVGWVECNQVQQQ